MVKFDVIRTIEACYATAHDEEAWLQGVVESLRPLGDDRGIFAQVLCGTDRGFRVESESAPGIPRSNFMDTERFCQTAPIEAVRHIYAPSPPVEYAVRRAERLDARFGAQVRSLLRGFGLEDTLGVFAGEPNGGTVLVVITVPLGEPRVPPRTMHQLARFSAHLCSSARLRRAVGEGDEAMPGDATEAVLDPVGRVLDAVRGARPKDIRRALAVAVRRMDRARGALRRTDPEEALQLWQGLVDGTWSLVEQFDADGRRYILARRNQPGVRDPRALTQRERSVAAFASMGHQNKFIGYLLGISSGTVAGHLRSAQRKLGLASRAELIRSFASLLLQVAPEAVGGAPERASSETPGVTPSDRPRPGVGGDRGGSSSGR